MQKTLFVIFLFLIAETIYAQKDSVQLQIEIDSIQKKVYSLLEKKLNVNVLHEQVDAFRNVMHGLERKDTTISFSLNNNEKLTVYVRHHHRMVGVEIRLFDSLDQEILLYRSVHEKKIDYRDSNCLSFESISREGKTLFFFLETSGKSRNIYSTLLELAKDAGESPESYLQHFCLE